MNFPLPALVAYVYSPTLFAYGVYVSVTVSLPTPVLTLLVYVEAPLTHVVLYAVICVLVNAFLDIPLLTLFTVFIPVPLLLFVSVIGVLSSCILDSQGYG